MESQACLTKAPMKVKSVGPSTPTKGAFRWKSLSIACLAWVALLNGYPLLFFDSGTYLNTAVSRFYAPFDRPVIYGWFLYLTTLNISPWMAVFAQASVVLAMVDLVRRTLFPGAPSRDTGIAVAVLSSVSMIPFFVAQIMPDFFTGLIPLAMALLIFAFERLSLLEKAGLAVLLFFGIGAHTSHLPSAMSGLAVALVWRSIMRAEAATALRSHWYGTLRGLVVVSTSMVAAATALLATNYVTYGRLTLSPGSHVFLMGRLLADGTAVDYLKRHCPQDGLKICDHLDEIPSDANDYIWHAPLLKKLGNWSGSRTESQTIIGGTFREDAPAVALNAAIAAARVFLSPGIKDTLEPVYPEDPMHVVAFRRIYPQDTEEWFNSLQQQGRLESAPFKFLSLVQKSVYWCAFAFLAWMVMKRGRRERLPAAAALTCLSFLVMNAAICGALGGVFERYQGRASWIVVLLGTLCVLELRRGSAVLEAKH